VLGQRKEQCPITGVRLPVLPVLRSEIAPLRENRTFPAGMLSAAANLKERKHEKTSDSITNKMGCGNH
jgi:hypothetical protein